MLISSPPAGRRLYVEYPARGPVPAIDGVAISHAEPSERQGFRRLGGPSQRRRALLGGARAAGGGRGGRVRAVEVLGPFAPAGRPEAVVRYLGEDFEVVARPPVVSYSRREARAGRFRRGDADGDGVVVLADAVAVLSHLFRGAGPLPEPSGGCGWDPTPDGLGCPGHTGCGG